MSFKKSTLLFKVLFLGFFLFPIITFASTSDGTILNPAQYAWGDNVGWINLGTTEGNVHITNTGLTGYMWDSIYGWVNLNPTGSGVTNDGNGNLSGFAWSAGAGFIDFSGVTISPSGIFAGVANGVTYGHINFSCSTCNVVTDWRPVSQQLLSNNASVGPVSVFLNNHANNSEYVGTSSEVVNNEPQISESDFIGYIKQLFTGKKSQNSSPTSEVKNPVNEQPVINNVGIPVIKKPVGRDFSTSQSIGSKTGSEIATDIIVKGFKSIISWFNNIFVNILPGSILLKSIFGVLFLIITYLIFRAFTKNH